MLRKTYPWFSFLIALIITGCTIFSTPAPQAAWYVKWLKNPACSPPCWEDITPGVTTISEAISILKKMPDISKIAGPYRDPSGSKEQDFSWEFKEEGESGIAYAYDDKGTISTLSLGSRYSGRYKIKEVVDVYGPPSHVLPYGCLRGVCDTDLVYVDQGFMIDSVLPYKGEMARLSPNANIYGISFFPGGGNGYQTTFGKGRIYPGSKLLEWKGYAEYPMQ